MLQRLFIPLVTVTVLLSLTGCSSIISTFKSEPFESEQDERSSGSYLDDEIIETKALVNLDKTHPDLAQSHIIVTSYNGVVLLAGQVPSEQLRQRAATTVANIGKVKRVHNELTVAGNTSMVARSNDAWITTKVKTKLLASSETEGNRIKVVTENGVVYLMGIVTRDEGDRAAESARRTAGVQKVVRIFEYF